MVKYNKKSGRLHFGRNAYKAGIESIDEAGMARMGKQYSLLYELTGNSRGIFPVLRFYDIRFQILMDLKKKKNYLEIIETYESPEQAEVDMEILEEDMKKNLTCGLKRQNLSERLTLIHEMSSGDAGYIRTDRYIHGGDWVSEVCMERVEETSTSLAFGSGRKNYYQVSCFMEPEYISDYAEALKNSSRYLLLDFAAVSDQAVRQFMEETYLGLESIAASIKIHSKELYQVMFTKETEDQHCFVLFGCYLVRSSASDEFKSLDKAFFHECKGIQKRMYQAILPNAEVNIAQMRVCASGTVSDIIDRILE